MQHDTLYIGLDLGTSGARAIVMNETGQILSQGKSMMGDHGSNHRDPKTWWAAAVQALKVALQTIDRRKIRAICVDGTSGTMLPIDINGHPLDHARMYNDPCNDPGILDIIAKHAPKNSAAHGVTSGLAKALQFQQHGLDLVVHQADWIAGKLCGVFSSDDNNALKTGYNSITGCWPKWMEKTGINMTILPKVNQPGMPVALITPDIAQKFNLPNHVMLIAGTTDGCASFLATGVDKTGEGVSALGTTLTIKLLSDTPIFDPDCGVYSHHILGKWLAGGASNTGGNVLLKYFTTTEITKLSKNIDSKTHTGLQYYPLSSEGERFPIKDPKMQPRLLPRPKDNVKFLQAIFEGIADIEALAYKKLEGLGAPALRSVRTVGGGAKNTAWNDIRKQCLGVELKQPLHSEAAFGAARLAQFGLKKWS